MRYITRCFKGNDGGGGGIEAKTINTTADALGKLFFMLGGDFKDADFSLNTEALKAIYEVLGGDSADVADLSTIPAVISKIADVVNAGGGGGGDLKTVKLTFTGPDSASLPFALPTIASNATIGDKQFNDIINPQITLIGGNVYNIPCSSGGVVGTVLYGMPSTLQSILTLHGDIEDISSSAQYMVRIYGDCEIVHNEG